MLATVKTFRVLYFFIIIIILYLLHILLAFKCFKTHSWCWHARVSLTLMEMPRAWKSSGCHGSARGHDRHDKEPDAFPARKTANGRKMRRKTIAKRILYNGYEGYEETPEDSGARANHVFSVCKHHPFVA